MSTRKRIVRATIAACIILGIGSIGSAGAFASHALEPSQALAAPAYVEQGVLGVGERMSAPLDEPVSTDEKISTGFLGAKSDSLSLPAAKASTPFVPKPSARRASVSGTRNARVRRTVTSQLGSGWRRARVSWYGPGFYGHTMAGGGTLTRSSMVVAHRSLPFGTRIEFRYRGRSCVAVVRDRGPFIAGRVFDLGPGTARALGFSGVATVTYRILGR